MELSGMRGQPRSRIALRSIRATALCRPRCKFITDAAFGLPPQPRSREHRIPARGVALDPRREFVRAAAERLGLHRSNLYRKMRQLGMETGEG